MQIGEQLKEAREQKNLTLDDIQATTKIQKRYLVAIEQNDFHALPGRFYARAFIKEYAIAVGLDANLLLTNFDEEKISSNNEETESYSRLKRTRKSKSVKGTSIFSYLPSVIVVLLIASILIVAWTLYQKSLTKPTGDSIEEQETDEIIQRQQDETEPIIDEQDEDDATEEDENDDLADTNTREQQSSSFTVIETGTGSSPESTVKYVSNSDTIKVVLRATEDAYVQVKGDSGHTYIDRLFSANMTEEFDLSTEQRIYFNIGHAPGMEITINDSVLQYPVNATESVHQKIWVEVN